MLEEHEPNLVDCVDEWPWPSPEEGVAVCHGCRRLHCCLFGHGLLSYRLLPTMCQDYVAELSLQSTLRAFHVICSEMVTLKRTAGYTYCRHGGTTRRVCRNTQKIDMKENVQILTVKSSITRHTVILCILSPSGIILYPTTVDLKLTVNPPVVDDLSWTCQSP